MKTFRAICLKDTEISEDGQSVKLFRGDQYTISAPDENNNVTVFTVKWITGVPVDIFGGIIPGFGEAHDGKELLR